MAEAYRLYAGTQSGMIIFRGVGDIWTSMGGSREFEPYFKEKVVDSVYGCKHNLRRSLSYQRLREALGSSVRRRHPLGHRGPDR